MKALDDLSVRVVVVRKRILTRVEVGEAFGAVPVDGVVGPCEPIQVERGKRFPRVLPIEGRYKLPPVHAVFGHLDPWRTGFGVLAYVSLPSPLVEPQHILAASEGIQQGPSAKILHSVVRPVVTPPALNTLQVTQFVDILGKERLRTLGCRVQQEPLRQSPWWRRNRFIQDHG